MADIFVSYSRKEEVFGRKLHARLTGVKRDVWMDWEDIPFNSDWWQEIRRGIETSDNFLIILSNDFVRSPVCMLEVDYARRNNKRILVIAHNFEERGDVSETLQQRTEDSDTVQQLLGDRDIVALSHENWMTIGHVNWLFFNDEDNFDDNFTHLIETLDTDLNHVRNHTNLQVRGLEWETNNENWSFLLTGVQIDQAEQWLQEAEREQKSPHPTEVQRNFIRASREQQITQDKAIDDMQTRTRRFRQASIVGGSIAAIMAIFAIGLTFFAGRSVQQSSSDLATARNQVTQASGILTVVPQTFEAVNHQIATNEAEIAAVGETLTPIVRTLAGVEEARGNAQALADNAQTEVANANATLMPIPVTLTQSADDQALALAQVETASADSGTAQADIISASTQIANTNRQIEVVNARLTQVIPTLTQASSQVISAETEVAGAETQIFNVDNRIATADARNQSLASTSVAIEIEADRNRRQAQSQSLIVDAEQASINGNIDLALALILESYDIDRDLPQMRRLFNSLAYTSARFVLPETSFVAFSSESSMIAYADGKEIIIVDIASRSEIKRLRGHEDIVIDGEFNTRGDLFISGSADTTVIVWNTRTWEIEQQLTDHETGITDIAFDNRGNRISAVAGSPLVIIWDSADGYTPVSFDVDDPNAILTDVTFYDNGARVLATGTVGTIPVQYRINLERNRISRFTDRIYTDLNPAYNLEAVERVRFGMVETEEFLTVYNLLDGEEFTFVNGFNYGRGQDVIGVRAFNSAGSEVVVALNNPQEGISEIVLYSTAFRERESGLVFDGEATERVTALAFSPDGRTILSGFGGYLVLWDAETGRELRRFGAHLDDIVEIIYSADSNYAITRSRDGNFRVWDVSFSDPAVINRFEVPNNSGEFPINPGLSSDNVTVYITLASDILGFDTKTGIRTLNTFSFAALEHAFYSRSRPLMVTTAEDTPNVFPNARMFDLTRPDPDLWLDEIRPLEDEIINPVGAFSKDDRQIALSMSDAVRVYDVTVPEVRELTHTFFHDGMDISAFVFGAEGRYLYAATNQLEEIDPYNLMRLDLLENTVVTIPLPHIRRITSMDISDDGTKIITASEDQTLVLFDLETETLVRRMIGHSGIVNGVYFGLNDEVALSVSEDGTMILWDLDTAQRIRQYVVGNPISGLYLSTDDSIAVTTDNTDFVTIWQIETVDDVVDWVLDNRAITPLTEEECLQYNIVCDDDDDD